MVPSLATAEQLDAAERKSFEMSPYMLAPRVRFANLYSAMVEAAPSVEAPDENSVRNREMLPQVREGGVKPFGTTKRCPKCGSYSSTVRWEPEEFAPRIRYKYNPDDVEDRLLHPEQMRSTCSCGFAWLEAPLDAKGEKA